MSIPQVRVSEGPIEMYCFEPCDLELAPPTLAQEGNPFDLDFRITFWGPDSSVITIPGYYDDLYGYMVRFSATAPGPWHYASRSPVPALDGRKGSIWALPARNENAHGRLLVDAAFPRHFVFEDGSRFYPLAYEADWLLVIDQGKSDLQRVERFLEQIHGAGFNVVTANVYAYNCPGWLTPEQEADPRYIKPIYAPWVGGNSNPDYTRFDSAFFQHMDQIMLALLERGMLIHLMLHVYNKGVRWPALDSADDERYWRYVVARYQAFCNVIWDPAKESYYRKPEYIWSRLAVLRQHDGYQHLVTVHDANRPRGSSSKSLEAAYDARKDLTDALADFKSDQVHADHYLDALGNYLALPRPYVNVEYGYEEGVEDLPTYQVKQNWREVLRRTWLVTMGGGYPNYYYSNTAWNLFLPEPEPPGYAAHRHCMDFWLGSEYWRLVPDQRPLGRGIEGIYCRADPGREYVVMAESTATFDLELGSTPGPLRGVWFNPFTGEKQAAGEFGAGTHSFSRPWPQDEFAVLHLASPEEG